MKLIVATLAKLVIIFKLGLRNISRRITSLIFCKHYTPPQHALTRIILSFNIIDKGNSKFHLRIKEALNINWRKPNLNAQQLHLLIGIKEL